MATRQHNQANQSPILRVDVLLNRQITDWQRLLAEGEASGASPQLIEYCQAQIDRLKGELQALSN